MAVAVRWSAVADAGGDVYPESVFTKNFSETNRSNDCPRDRQRRDPLCGALLSRMSRPSVGQLMFPVSSQVLLEEAQEEELITVDAVGCFEEEGEEEEEGAVVEEEVDVADEEEDAATKEKVKSGRPVASGEITIQE